jgi:hypothetical protein
MERKTMHDLRRRRASAVRRPLEESRGGWALFGRLLVWSTRNNHRPA